jgi:hypothetical protein
MILSSPLFRRFPNVEPRLAPAQDVVGHTRRVSSGPGARKPCRGCSGHGVAGGGLLALRLARARAAWQRVVRRPHDHRRPRHRRRRAPRLWHRGARPRRRGDARRLPDHRRGDHARQQILRTAPRGFASRSTPETRKAPRTRGPISTATGIRTRVSAMRGRRPSPLDDSGAKSLATRLPKHARDPSRRAPAARALRASARPVSTPTGTPRSRMRAHARPARRVCDIFASRTRMWRNW